MHGVQKKFLGKTFEGTLRKTYLINPKGEIQKVYDNVNPLIHAGQVVIRFRLRRLLKVFIEKFDRSLHCNFKIRRRNIMVPARIIVIFNRFSKLR